MVFTMGKYYRMTQCRLNDTMVGMVVYCLRVADRRGRMEGDVVYMPDNHTSMWKIGHSKLLYDTEEWVELEEDEATLYRMGG